MEFKPDGEAALVRLAAAGDAEAFRELQTRYSETVQNCLQSEPCPADNLPGLTDKTWMEINGKISAFDPSRAAFSAFVDNRSRFVKLKHYAAPELRNSSAAEILIRALRDQPSPLRSDKELEELLLVIQAQAGDSESFNQLWSDHQEALFGFIRWQIRCADADRIAREILSDAFVFLRSHISDYDPNRSRFRTFAKLHVDSLRKKRFRRGREMPVSWVSDPDQEDPVTRLPEPPDPSRSIEHELIQYEQAKHLLRVSFGLSCPPHQLVTFGFNRLLEWKPRNIVKELSGHPLADIEVRLENGFIGKSPYDEEFVRDCFTGLRQGMEALFGSLVTHPKAQRAHPNLLHRKTGTILLRDFYPDNHDREDAVTKWSNNVWKSLRIRMLDECWTGRDP